MARIDINKKMMGIRILKKFIDRDSGMLVRAGNIVVVHFLKGKEILEQGIGEFLYVISKQ